MTVYTYPSDRLAVQVRQSGAPVLSLASATAQVFTDPTGTVPATGLQMAEDYGLGESFDGDYTFTLDRLSQLPVFTAPTEGPLYVRVNGQDPVQVTYRPDVAGLLDQAKQDLTTTVQHAMDSLIVNVKTYGATGNGTTDDTSAIQSALAALPEGSTLYFPTGRYRITKPLALTRNQSLAGESVPPRWSYTFGLPSSTIVAGSGFVGPALIQLKDKELLPAGAAEQGGQRLVNLSLDGTLAPAGTDGILATGLVRDVIMQDVQVYQAPGKGIHTVSYTRADSSINFARGWMLERVSVVYSGDIGFALNSLDDSRLHVLAVGCHATGIWAAGCGETTITGRSVFNTGHGLWLTGSAYGNVQVTEFSTDRNSLDGVRIDVQSAQPVLLSTVTLRRDGKSSGYSLNVTGASCPVLVSGLTTEVGIDDNGTGAVTPATALNVSTSTGPVIIANAVLWGATAAYQVDAGSQSAGFRLGQHVVQMTGSTNYSGTVTVNTKHPVSPAGMTGAAVASRYVGATSSGTAPTTGTFAVGDYVVDASNGSFFVCTVAGTPGTWQAVGRLTNTTTPVAVGSAAAAIGTSASAARADHSHALATHANTHLSGGSDPLLLDSESLTTGESTRDRTAPTSSSQPTSGTVYLSYFTARKSATVTTAAVFVEGTAGSGLTAAQLGLYSVDGSGNLTLVASSASDTTGWSSTFTKVTKTLQASYATVRGQRYAFAVVIAGTTTPALVSNSGSATVNAQPPRMTGVLTGQSALPASITSGSVANDFRSFFGVVSP